MWAFKMVCYAGECPGLINADSHDLEAATPLMLQWLQLSCCSCGVLSTVVDYDGAAQG